VGEAVKCNQLPSSPLRSFSSAASAAKRASQAYDVGTGGEGECTLHFQPVGFVRFVSKKGSRGGTLGAQPATLGDSPTDNGTVRILIQAADLTFLEDKSWGQNWGWINCARENDRFAGQKKSFDLPRDALEIGIHSQIGPSVPHEVMYTYQCICGFCIDVKSGGFGRSQGAKKE
jgi:hypothetical protein